MMDTAKGVKLGCNWQSIYFIKYCFDLDLEFEGSQENRAKLFEAYIIPLVMPFVENYGLNDESDPSEEDVRECVSWLEGDFTECDTLKEWCERKGYKALCYWDLNDDPSYIQCPVWLK
jgi:hypothetical protein